MKKIYFAGSIRAGRENAELYAEIIANLNKANIVLTEHLGDKTISAFGENNLTDEQIYERDISWLKECNVVVADVSTPSLGVGYELAFAEKLKKQIICIYKEQEGKRLSAMVSGNKKFKIIKYNDASVVEKIESLIK